jgi:hypothetical protein
MTAAVETLVGNTYTVTAFVLPGQPVGPNKVQTAILDLSLKSASAPGKGTIMLVVPTEWMEEAARASLPTKVTDEDQKQTWAVNNTPGTEWVIELSPESDGKTVTGAWELHLAVPIKKPAKDTDIKGAKLVLFDLAAAALPDIPVQAQAQAKDPVVRLETTPQDTVALRFGQPVTLKWTLENIVAESATLRGSLLGGRDTAAVPGNTLTVWALDRAEYVLEAEILINKVKHRVSRQVTIDIDRPQYGFRALLRPDGRVLPSGPVACFWIGVNLTHLRFDVQSSEKNRVVPDLSKHQHIVDASKPEHNKSFQIQRGPGEEGEAWTIQAKYDTNDPKGLEMKKTVDLPVTAVAAREVKTVPSPQSAVLGFTAGRFSDGEKRTVEWVAVATDQGLEVHFIWTTDQKTVARCERPKAKGACLGVTGVGDPNERRALVAVVQDGSSLKLQKFSLPGLTMTREDTLPTAFDGAKRLQLVSIGNRVYVRGDGVASSYDHTETVQFIDEPWLAQLQWPTWEVVAVPVAAGAGYLYALERRSGALLRFDQRTVEAGQSAAGSLLAPREAASVNHRLAKLDLLQRAQLGNKAYLLGAGLRYNLTNRAGGDGPFVVDKRRIWQDDPRCVDGNSAFLVVGGALVARSTRADKGHDDVLQDRVYDPRLDVWVRCGRLFPGVEAGHFACTRSMPRFATSGDSARPVSTDGSIYCRKQDGTLWRIEGELLELLGFAGMNVAPLGELSPIGATRWRGRTLAAGSELKPEQYLLSRNGQYQLVYQPDGDLVLYRLGSATTWEPKPAPKKTDDKQEMTEPDKRGTWELERTALWRTGTPGKPGNAGCVRLQASDGDLVVYRTASGTEPAWAAHEHGAICGAEHDAFDVAATIQQVSREHDHASEYSGSSLVLEDDGRLEIRSRSGVLLWRAPRKIVRELPAGEWLSRADNLVSHDGTHSFVNDRDWAMAQLGADGHLRVYGRRSLTPLWSTEQSGGRYATTGSVRLVVENTGEIAVSDSSRTLWSSFWARGSSGSRLDRGQWFESPGGEYRLVLQQHGDLVLYNRGGTKVWATNTGGGGSLYVADNGDLGGICWWASEHGGVCEGPYRGRCGGIQMTAKGFQVVSTSPATVWYDVTDDGGGFPPEEKVRRRNSRRCRIYNEMQNGYMFAAGNWRYHKNENCRGVFVPPGAGADFVDSVWVVSEVQAGRFAIYNEHHNEWLFASGTFLTVEATFDRENRERRNIFATSDKLDCVFAVGGQQEGFFELSLHGGSTTIRSVAKDEYVYAASFEPVGTWCRVLSWIPKDADGHGLLVSNGYWQLQDV